MAFKNRNYMELKDLIERHGIKQSWIATKLGISSAYLSLILNEKRRLTEKIENDFSQLIDHIKGERR